jgi:enamine deaminase RidA (YjgF/YER057c/UK114 family)
MQTSLRIPVVIMLFVAAAVAAGQTPTVRATAEQRLSQLGVTLPAVSKPVGIYRRAVVVDNLIHLAGHIPIDAEGHIVTGKVGENVSLESAQEAARLSGLAMLATLRGELGSLDRVERLVKTVGMVNCTADFVDQPAVINGCSQLFKDIFGEQRGVGARSAVGMNSLPKGAVVEIEAIFEIARE